MPENIFFNKNINANDKIHSLCKLYFDTEKDKNKAEKELSDYIKQNHYLYIQTMYDWNLAVKYPSVRANAYEIEDKIRLILHKKRRIRKMIKHLIK